MASVCQLDAEATRRKWLLHGNLYDAGCGRVLADNADLRNGRDHSATGRNAVYSGRPTTRRLLPELLRTRRSDSVSDNIFAVATHSGISRLPAPDLKDVESGYEYHLGRGRLWREHIEAAGAAGRLSIAYGQSIAMLRGYSLLHFTHQSANGCPGTDAGRLHEGEPSAEMAEFTSPNSVKPLMLL